MDNYPNYPDNCPDNCPNNYPDTYPIGILEKANYPRTLSNMPNPPKRLFMRGSLSAEVRQRYLCVIGSRGWSEYGRECTYKLIQGLAGYPITIVSGLAIGIDSISHRAALNVGLHCLAFPGSSLDWGELYPPTHLDLARSIVAAGGALLSEWEPGYETGKWAFPSRNRLMAGIADAVLVVEAGRRSGSLMTAEYAADFSREVLAVPGSIFTKQTYGPHMLIGKGAIPATSSADILRTLGFEVPKGNRTTVPAEIKNDPMAMKIIDILEREDCEIDKLAEYMRASLEDVLERICILEGAKLIGSSGGKIKIRNTF